MRVQMRSQVVPCESEFVSSWRYSASAFLDIKVVRTTRMLATCHRLVSPDVLFLLLSVVLVEFLDGALRSSDGVFSPELRGLFAFLNLRLLLLSPFPREHRVQRSTTIVEGRQRT